MLTDAFWARLIVAGAVLAIAAAGVQAAPGAAASQDVHRLLSTPTADTRNSTGQYLAPAAGPKGLDPDILLAAVPWRQREYMSAYSSPRLIGETPGQAPSAATYASLVYPTVTGLAGMGTDERSVPLTNTAHLSMAPGGVGRVMLGRAGTLMDNWNRAGETAISYIRPHVNIQMMFALEASGKAEAGDFEGPGVAPRAYMAVDHQTKVDSTEIGTATEHFGSHRAPTPVDEPQTAVSAGLDLGLLPTFLSQMGVNLSVVASRGHDTGNVSVALVGTTELPIDWAPRERPYMHPTSLGVEMAMNGPVGSAYYGGSAAIASGGTPASGGGSQAAGLIEIAPVVPEPFTLGLLGAGALALLARRRS